MARKPRPYTLTPAAPVRKLAEHVCTHSLYRFCVPNPASVAPAYSTASSHPLAQSALPPLAHTSNSPSKSRSRGEDDESYLSEDAEGESDDDDGDASGEVVATDYAALSRRKVGPADASGDGK